MKMKITFSLLILVISILFSAPSVQAQAWQRNSKVLGLGFGASQFFHIDSYYYNTYGGARRQGWYWPITGQINFQGEFGVHKYLGLGFTTGIGGRARYGNSYAGEFNIPIGIIFNFHFYQLIADRKSKAKHADKLDLYFGANAGSGIAVTYYKDLTRVMPLAFGGLHFGLRYYFTPKVGVNGEFGWGKSLVNVGFVFKI